VPSAKGINIRSHTTYIEIGVEDELDIGYERSFGYQRYELGVIENGWGIVVDRAGCRQF
jgi:hypothetical protein